METPPQTPVLSPKTPFDLIHVGKCGGGTIASELRAANYRFEKFHLRRPIARPGSHYVLLVRDPVARFVSAFNWRAQLYQSGILPRTNSSDPASELRHRTERELFFLYKNANSLAEQLSQTIEYEDNPTSILMGLIGHVPQGFHWYLNQLIDRIEPMQISGIICTERLSDDFERLFGFRPTSERHRSKTAESPLLSERGRANLVREFQLEYKTLDVIATMAVEAGVTMSMRYDPALGAIPNPSVTFAENHGVQRTAPDQ